jgi:hypothetical protein
LLVFKQNFSQGVRSSAFDASAVTNPIANKVPKAKVRRFIEGSYRVFRTPRHAVVHELVAGTIGMVHTGHGLALPRLLKIAEQREAGPVGRAWRNS